MAIDLKCIQNYILALQKELATGNDRRHLKDIGIRTELNERELSPEGSIY